jgi:hypothetical protein
MIYIKCFYRKLFMFLFFIYKKKKKKKDFYKINFIKKKKIKYFFIKKKNIFFYFYFLFIKKKKKIKYVLYFIKRFYKSFPNNIHEYCVKFARILCNFCARFVCIFYTNI